MDDAAREVSMCIDPMKKFGGTMIIRKAAPDEYQDVRAFYHSLIDALQGSPYGAGWIKDVYPAPEYLMESVRAGQLYIGTDHETIIAAMIVNHECNEAYMKYSWPTEAEPDEVTVIHALGVHSLYTGKGYARQMVQFAIGLARENRQKVIRLDVLKGNMPAEKLYISMGFRYLHTLNMYYEDTGWTEYGLYEYVI